MSSLILSMLSLILLQAQDPIIRYQISTPEQTLKRITTDDGLPSNQVISIVQDGDGFMWVGTRSGLSRFDGLAFKTYREDSENEYALSSSFIHLVMTDDDKKIWVLTDDGTLHAFNSRHDTFLRIHDIPSETPLPRHSIYDVFGTEETGWWIGTHNGLYYLNAEKTEVRFIDPGMNIGHVTDYLRRGDEKAIYFTSFRRGVFRFDMETGQTSPQKQINRHLSNYATNHITQTREGHFIIVEHTTISIISEDGVFISTNNMRGGQIYFVFTDSEYNTWFMHGYTIRKFDDKTGRATSYLTIQGALSMYVDRSQVIWIDNGGRILTGYGLFAFDTKTMRFGYSEKKFPDIVHNPFLAVLEENESENVRTPDWAIMSVKESTNDDIWYLTRRRGLFRFRHSNSQIDHFDFLTTSSDPRTPDAFDFLWVDDETIAVSTSRGLVLISIESRSISLLEQDRVMPGVSTSVAGADVNRMNYIAGFYWFATSGHGLHAYHPETGETLAFIHNPEDRFSIGNNNVITVSEDPLHPERYLWVGTNLGGLNRIDLVNYSVDRMHYISGFEAMMISGIHSDGESGLWLTTERGLTYLDVSTLDFVNYAASDGVQGRYNYFFRNHQLKKADGSILICDSNGCNSFFPDAITTNQTPPEIGITNIKVMNESVMPISSQWFTNAPNKPLNLEVRWNQNIIGVEFASLEYSSPQKNRHKYRVPPFLNDWIHISNNREITLTNLDPGSYTLEILGSNNDGTWGSEPAQLTIDIIPPFWMTFTFRFIAICILIALVGGIVWIISRRKYQAKLRELEYKMAVDNERLRISRDMHDNLGSRLTQIQLMSRKKASKKKGDALEQTLQEISKETEGVIQNVSQIVWALNPENDTLENFMGFMIQYTETFCQRAQIACRIKADEEFPKLSIASDKRHHLLNVVKEAVNNAVKHAACTVIKLGLHCHQNEKNQLVLFIEIEDDGSGFDPDLVKSKKRNGLKSMKSRIESIGGEYALESSPEKGTRVHIKCVI